jgi:cytochrome c oxidase subunit 2
MLALTPITTAGTQIDAQFHLTMIITGAAFVLAQLALGWFIFRYRDRGVGKVRYVHGNNLVEVGGVVLTGVVFMGLAVLGQRVWAQVHMTESPAGAVRIEITAEQFLWNMRYPGPDGRFGRTSPKYYEPVGNTVGIVPDDPAGADDFIIQNNLVVPMGQPVELILRSKDVLHSFFVPSMRLKQDTVPGLEIPLRFTATATGEFEIACAELCGLAHYRMRGFMKVVEPAAYETWLAEQQAPAGAEPEPAAAPPEAPAPPAAS